ncbi:hypothetical protein FRB94_006229 [Tulasnella sp. JGI-2019a]|nr:hypothetical protein FRB93_006674 [Tulasnella sp. JGI-2019a]KAG8999331.1 hypothetical protein FRB94_006229 [Tulasnella sp. JGI-2019a]
MPNPFAEYCSAKAVGRRKAMLAATPTATLLDDPTGTLLSERRTTPRPDGYLVLGSAFGGSLRLYATLKHQEKPSTGNVLSTYLEDIAILLEYNKDDTPHARLDVCDRTPHPVDQVAPPQLVQYAISPRVHHRIVSLTGDAPCTRSLTRWSI